MSPRVGSGASRWPGNISEWNKARRDDATQNTAWPVLVMVQLLLAVPRRQGWVLGLVLTVVGVEEELALGPPSPPRKN